VGRLSLTKAVKMIFTAQKEIPQSDVGVTCGRPVIMPPTTSIDEAEKVVTIPATIDLQIKGVEPITLLDKEWIDIKKIIIAAAKRGANLKEVTAITETAPSI